jgi:arginyl-tRNA synthetase
LFRIIGLGALKYFILKVDPKKNMLFDPKESIDFNGNTGPFIQYTYARIQSLLKKAAETGFGLKDKKLQFSAGLLERERELLKVLHRFSAVVSQAASEYNPAVIANYTYELAKEYNQFYQEVPVLREEDRSKVELRLLISSFTGNIIRKSMKLLGIEVPSRM